MKRVGLRELKNRLSEYVRYVRAGHAIEVTDRGEVVAELRPLAGPRSRPASHPACSSSPDKARKPSPGRTIRVCTRGCHSSCLPGPPNSSLTKSGASADALR